MRNRNWARRKSPRSGNNGHLWAFERFEARTLFSAPLVTVTSPADFGLGVGIGAKVSVRFNEPMDRATVGAATFTLRDSTDAAVPAVVTYNAANATATLDAAAPLAYGTTYTATVFGGAGGVQDVSGEALEADHAWSFTTVANPTSGPGGPILVVTSGSNAFGSYYPEILRAEGLNEFATADVGAVSPALLAQYQVVLLGETPLSAAQVGVLSDWVSGGGNLIAMRPDKQLAGLLGLSDAGTTLADSYLLVDTASGPGAGITDQTIQYHGVADEYALSGAASIATLYANAAIATGRPAVTLREVGANGGQAAAFTYDLARSIVYTRQGNPAWSGQERDGQPLIRSDDLFFGNKPGDPQKDYVDLNKVAIPQADEQQRLLANLIGRMNLDNSPLPKFWYFPRGAKAVVVMSGDDHASGGTLGRFNKYIANSPAGSSPDDWTALRGSSYIYPNTPITDAQAASLTAAGFEIGLHPTTFEQNWTPASLEDNYATQLAEFHARFPSLPSPSSSRTHAIVWSDYTTQPQVELAHRIRLDENYYYWPGAWVQDRPGMFTGSGIPMRFATATGDMIDVYQAATQLTDESGQTYPKNINALLDNALGAAGYYGVFTANIHTDQAASTQSDSIIAAAQARGVSVVSGRQMLAWLDGRNGSSFGSIQWDAAASTLSFTVTSADGADGLQGMLPTHSAGAVLSAVTLNGAAVPFSVETIKGVEYAFYPAAAGSYVAQYVPDATPPVVSAVHAAPSGTQGQVITWTTDEPSTTRVDYGPSPQSLTSTATATGLGTAHQLLLTGLTPGATYYYRVTSADVAGNSATSPALGDAPADFTVALGLFADTAVADFSGGTGDGGTYISQTGDGELTLVPATGEEFSGTTLPAGWSSTPWNAGGAVTVAGGGASVDGSLLGSSALYSSGHSLEFVATFGGAPFQHAGFGTNLTSPPWAIFSTGSSGGGLFARTAGAATVETPIPGNWLGAPHRFRIDWAANSVAYSIDGTRVASHAVSVSGSSRPVVSDFGVDGNVIAVDWIHVTPYATPATFLSRVFAAPAPVQWSAVEWDAATPAGTSLALSLRTGGTPTPDSTWSDFLPVASTGAPLNASGRYAQYRVDLATTDPDQTPVLRDVTVFYLADQTPPTITGRSPAPNATGVDTAQVVSVTFSEDMDPATIGAATFGLRISGAAADTAATVSYDPATRTATLQPAAPLSSDASYQVTVAGTVTDLAGNPLGADATWTFATMDTVAPTIIARSPLPGAASVATGTSVTVTFSEAIDPATLGAAFRLRVDGAATDVVASVSYDPATRTATLQPAQALSADANYQVTLSGAVTDLVGNPLGADATWSFATVDTIAPTIAARSPFAGATGVAPGSAVTVTFSEAIDPATIGAATFRLRIDGTATDVAASVSYDPATRTATLQPSSLLSANANYQATVSASVTDLAGNPLAADVTWSFTTVDTIVPTVISLNPAAGAAGIGTAQVISVTFSEAMNAATINAAAFRLRAAGSGADAPATISYDPASRTATLQPAAPLSANTSYEVTLSGTLTDLAGNPLGADATWNFTTVDTIAPTIVARGPAAGAAGVGTAQVVSVTFSEAIDAATIGAATFRLRAAGSATDVVATISYDAATRTATLQPAALLSANTSYQVTLSGTVTDLAGNPLGADATWGFATVDTIAPTVIARSPAAGATGVAPGTVVTVTFSEAIAAGTINGTTFLLRDPGNNLVAATVSYNAGTNTATLTPSAPLASPATYTVTVAGATDLAGNAIAGPMTWSFSTADVPPTVIAKSPAPGATTVAPGTTVTVTFSESIQLKTLSFVLKTASGSSVAAKVTYNDATRTATLTPNSPLQSATTYTVTVSGAKDLTGKTMTAPVVWSFTTVVPWIQTTLNDFAAGTSAGTMATNTGGGEVQLAAASVFEDFNGVTALPSTWTSQSLTPAGGGPTSVSVSGGVLSVAGANVVSNQTFVNAPVEGRVQFGAAANQSFGATNDAGTNFAVFTTKNTTNSLYAQVGANGLIKELKIGGLPSGFHVYRIAPVATGFQFYVDGSLKTTIAQTLPAGTPLKAMVSAFYGSPKPAILADWVHVLSYGSSGVFTSSVFDATRTATWGTLSFTGTVPTGTTMIVEVSSGNTATPDGTWSSWTRVTSGGAISAPAGRYLQYRVTFTTTNSAVTAVLNDVTITWK